MLESALGARLATTGALKQPDQQLAARPTPTDTTRYKSKKALNE